jgi:hypothetical protein
MRRQIVPNGGSAPRKIALVAKEAGEIVEARRRIGLGRHRARHIMKVEG